MGLFLLIWAAQETPFSSIWVPHLQTTIRCPTVWKSARPTVDRFISRGSHGMRLASEMIRRIGSRRKLCEWGWSLLRGWPENCLRWVPRWLWVVIHFWRERWLSNNVRRQRCCDWNTWDRLWQPNVIFQLGKIVSMNINREKHTTMRGHRMTRLFLVKQHDYKSVT